MALRGVYFISNCSVHTVIDLDGHGGSTDGTRVRAWKKTAWKDALNFAAANQLWLLEPVAGAEDTYTLQNIKAGTYMDLSGGSAARGTLITGWQHTDGENQKWVIRTNKTGFYKIQNVASQTFVDLSYGSGANGTKVQGWLGNWEAKNPHQLWVFERVSLSSDEINETLRLSQYPASDFRTYLVDGEYLILPRQVLESIWKDSGLKDRKWRKAIFDRDNFATVYKAAVATWGDDNIRADGISVFCGFMLRNPRNGRGGQAYNFTLSDDRQNILLFDAQTGTFQESSSFDYEGYF